MLIKFKIISMRLISKEDLGIGRVCFAGKSFDSIVRLASRLFQGFKYAYIVHILIFLYLIWFECFYDLQRRLQNLSKHPR